jgi:hypothetical protein
MKEKMPVFMLAWLVALGGCGCGSGTGEGGDAGQDQVEDGEDLSDEAPGDILVEDDRIDPREEDAALDPPADDPAVDDQGEDEIEHPVVAWAKIYDNSTFDTAMSGQQTMDGGYIVAGGTDTQVLDFWILKTDGEGAIRWEKTYGGADSDFATSIRQTIDGGYITCGITASFGAGEADIWVLELDSNGMVLWQKAYGSECEEYSRDIYPVPDGGYIVSGFRLCDGTGENLNAWVIKLDAEGHVSWQEQIDGGYSEIAKSLVPTGDGGSIFVSNTVAPSDGNVAWAVKLDERGAVEWQKYYDIVEADWMEAASIRQTSDGGYIVAGTARMIDPDDSNLLVFKLDASGNVAWSKMYDGDEPEGGPVIGQTMDSGYVVVGNKGYPYADTGSSVILAWRLDAGGDVTWHKTYGFENMTYGYFGHQTLDGGFVIGGASGTGSLYYAPMSIWVLKLDGSGVISPECPPGIGDDDGAAASNVTILPADSSVSPVPTAAAEVDTDAAPVDTSAAVDTQCSRSF